MVGSDAVMVWDYSVKNKTAELDDIVWSAFSRTLSRDWKLLQELNDGTLRYNTNMPPEYQDRVFKKDNATLVLKNLTLNDTTTFSCKITGKDGTSDENMIQLVVTGM